MLLPSFLASLPVPAAMRPLTLVVRALNAVLAREPWAQQRLQQYAGRRISLQFSSLHIGFSFNHVGEIVLADDQALADVQLSVPAGNLSKIPEAFSHSTPEALLALVHIQGDAGLASVLAQIASQLRIDPEAELARFTGDLLAVRLMAMGRQLLQVGKKTLQSIEGNAAEFLGEESGILVNRNYRILWQDRMQLLEQRLSSLEQRTTQLPYKG